VNTALAAGVPLLCIPFFVDNFYTAEVLSIKGLAPTPVDIRIPGSFQDELFRGLTDALSDESGYLENTADFHDRLHADWAIQSPTADFLDAINSLAAAED
jgi:hypothetical protein